MTQLVLPGMVKRKRGLVLTISSGAAVKPMDNMVVYGATKAFVDYFTQALAVGYRNTGVKILVSVHLVNSVC